VTNKHMKYNSDRFFHSRYTSVLCRANGQLYTLFDRGIATPHGFVIGTHSENDGESLMLHPDGTIHLYVGFGEDMQHLDLLWHSQRGLQGDALATTPLQ